MQPGKVRIIVGFFIGAFAGLSLATAVIPMVVTSFVELDSLGVLLEVQQFSLPTAILFAVAGAFVGWQGGGLFSSATLGFCGALSGLIVGAFGLNDSDTQLTLITLSTLTGLIYGGIGGLIIGKAFSAREIENEA